MQKPSQECGGSCETLHSYEKNPGSFRFQYMKAKLCYRMDTICGIKENGSCLCPEVRQQETVIPEGGEEERSGKEQVEGRLDAPCPQGRSLTPA